MMADTLRPRINLSNLAANLSIAERQPVTDARAMKPYRCLQRTDVDGPDLEMWTMRSQNLVMTAYGERHPSCGGSSLM